MKVFFGMILWFGLSKKPIGLQNKYIQVHISKKMPRNCFEILLSTLHFVDSDRADKNNKHWKMRPIIDTFNNLARELYISGADVCIDKTMVPW